MKTAEFIVIAGRKDIDDFMKAADLFHGKNLGEIETITISYKESETLSLERMEKLIPVLKEGFEKTGQIVSFIHLISIRNNDNITLNSIVKPYVDKSVREISNGKKSFVFKHFIEAYTPFKCETDEYYYITEII
jgi:hypothetical protein